jgi:hypothetical protein
MISPFWSPSTLSIVPSLTTSTPSMPARNLEMSRELSHVWKKQS